MSADDCLSTPSSSLTLTSTPSVIRESLGLHLPQPALRSRCILEGELVVYCSQQHKILPFDSIRRHVPRRGRFLHTEQDILPPPHESLMIVYFDLLLLDDQSLLGRRHSERFSLLQQIVRCHKGRAELVPRQVIDFGHRLAASDLRKVFANIIARGGEGLVVKPDEAYFQTDGHGLPRLSAGCCIKLKKEYIGSFGDVGDFAIVGAGYDAAKAKCYRLPALKWTHFYLGCIDNREQVMQSRATPEFIVVCVVELNESQLKTLTTSISPMAVPSQDNKATRLHLAKGIEQAVPLTVAFEDPPVVDVRCFRFHRPGNTGFWTPRFPTVTKFHFDRDYLEVLNFDSLQRMADEAATCPEADDSQENLAWIAKLEGGDSAFEDMSQSTTTTTSTKSMAALVAPSPRSARAPLPSTSPTSAGPSWPKGSPWCDPKDDTTPASGASAKKASGGCSYAGDRCQLARITVLLDTASLGPSPELATLLAAHGVEGQPVTADGWQDRQGPRGGTLLLIDSVDRSSEAVPLLARAEEARNAGEREERDWVELYDWRVLRHLSVLEDESATTKYYDGFGDAWRRWYCGLI